LLVFDIGGVASKSYEYGTTARGRRLLARTNLPKPHKIVGWGFFVPGVGLLLLAIVSLIAG
jgi:hypothetical protein